MSSIESQLELFRKGFPWLDIVAAATPGRGIEVLPEERVDELADYIGKTALNGKCKFVPASGAASRMFKDIFASMEQPNDAGRTLQENISKFAFYEPSVFDGKDAAGMLLTPEGLNYGAKPKGVLKFHRYPDEVRTALAEHLFEGQLYMRNADDSVNLVVTISPEHRELFEQALSEVKETYEKRYGVRYNVIFTYQDKETDTIAATLDNKPFLKEDGSILRRPAGHGALIYNLNQVEQEMVSIKNIDNVCVERMIEPTKRYKLALMGRALELRDTIFGYLYAFDQLVDLRRNVADFSYITPYNMYQDDPFATPECQELCNEVEIFLRDTLCIEMPEAKDCRDRAQKLMAKLNRPIRVCGMVRNEGEPGGGPYIVRAADGSTSLQILESTQIDRNNPEALAAMKGATHFNPVDLVCCLCDYKGQRFNLPDHVDPQTGFISSKSYQGRELKALELPGLWNGAMSDWNTLFVEVPVETFNPVKTVLDLLRPAHQN